MQAATTDVVSKVKQNFSETVTQIDGNVSIARIKKSIISKGRETVYQT
jgi:hypothetical protein